MLYWSDNKHIKKPYLDKWEIAFEENNYGEVSNNEKNTKSSPQTRYITVKKISTGEEKDFKHYSEAERYFGQKPRSFSSKAYKRPDTFVYKDEYQITKHY